LVRAVDLTAAFGGHGEGRDERERKTEGNLGKGSCVHARREPRARRSRAVRSTAPRPAFVTFVVIALSAMFAALKDCSFCNATSTTRESERIEDGSWLAETPSMLIRPTALAETVIGGAIEVHRALGPGLLESTYDACLAHELTTRGVPFRRQVPVPVVFKGVHIDCGYKADFVVDDELLLELKSVESVLPIHQAQVMTYLKLLQVSQAILINFNVTRLVDGLRNLLG
jgi:GxxExxY protein